MSQVLPRFEADEFLPLLDDHQELLRFITCGSVDDGKSTLIGRLLFEANVLLDDQLSALEADSKRQGTQAGAIDFALLVDGLAAEREQGITIDVAYRTFATSRRRFIVADTPGHEQYTRNMATGASTAELAVLLVDASQGLLKQTFRHARIAALLGIRKFTLAVNKMDLVAFDQAVFAGIEKQFIELCKALSVPTPVCIPMVALDGDNVLARSSRMPWYQGSSLLEHLESVPVEAWSTNRPMRLPVQWVNRPHSHFRGYAGLLCSGSVRPGDAVVALPSGKQAQVKSIVAWQGDLAIAEAGTSVTVTLDRELDISRGDVLCAANAPCAVSDQFEIDLIWLAEAALLPGRLYLIKSASKTVNGRISALKSVLNIQNGEIPQTQVAARTLQLNDIALANLILDEPIAFAPYTEDRTLGSLILIDRQSNATVGMGMIRFAQRRADNLKWQQLSVDKAARASLTRQKPSVLWFTGLSGAGKSTIANLLEQRLHARGHLTYLLDGDNVRHGLNKDLGFTDAARVENIRRVAEVAKLMADAGLMVLVAFISPFRAERAMARELLEPGEFIEIFVDAPLAVVEARDPKGLYAKARRGEIKHFTGISSTYEAPEHPELRIDTTQASAEAAAMQIDAWLQAQGRLGWG